MHYKNLFLLLLFTIVLQAHADDENRLLIEIFKYDGSVQCELNSGTPLMTMKKILDDQGIKVYSVRVSHDGLAYTAMCGSPTGKINIYQIKESDFVTAQSQGFKKYSEITSN